MTQAPKRRLAVRFDPNAYDGDGDGNVQDSTQFQRPAIAGSMTVGRDFVNRNNKILAALEAAKSPEERRQIVSRIAKEFNISEATVRRVLRNQRTYGVPSTSPETLRTAERQDEVLRLAKLGIGPRAIAKEVGLSERQVSVILKNNDVSARAVFQRKKKIVAAAARLDIDKKLLAEAFGMDYSSINRSLRDDASKYGDLTPDEKGELVYRLYNQGYSVEKIAKMLNQQVSTTSKQRRTYMERMNLQQQENIEDIDFDEEIPGVNTEIVNLVNANPRLLKPQARKFLLYLSNHSEEQTAAEFDLSITDVKKNRERLVAALQEASGSTIKKPRVLKQRYRG